MEYLFVMLTLAINNTIVRSDSNGIFVTGDSSPIIKTIF